MLSVIIAYGCIFYVTGMIVDQSLPPIDTKIPTSGGIEYSETSKWVSQHGAKRNKANYIYHRDKNGRITSVDYDFATVLSFTKDSLESRRINNDSDFSCFGDKESYNYLSMSHSDISAVRQLVYAQKSDITFIRKNILNNIGHFQDYEEVDAKLIQIESKGCYKCIDRTFHWRHIFYNIDRPKNVEDCYQITSEKYSY